MPVQRHLQRVYATLTVSLAITALGAYTDMVYGISGFLTSIGAFGCLLGLMWTPSSPATLVRGPHRDTKSLNSIGSTVLGSRVVRTPSLPTTLVVWGGVSHIDTETLGGGVGYSVGARHRPHRVPHTGHTASKRARLVPSTTAWGFRPYATHAGCQAEGCHTIG